MRDQQIRSNGRSRRIFAPDTPATYEEFRSLMVSGNATLDIAPNEAGISERGTPLNRETLLSTETQAALGFDPDEENTVDDAIMRLTERIYPVGSIYMSVSNVNPATLFGGTWQRWGNGRVPVGVATTAGDTDFGRVEQSGGERTHSLMQTEMPRHTHTQLTASAENRGEHQHFVGIRATTATDTTGGTNDIRAAGRLVRTPTETEPATNVLQTRGWEGIHTGGHTHTFAHSGGIGTENSNANGSAHNNLQPYITCFMWKRTA